MSFQRQLRFVFSVCALLLISSGAMMRAQDTSALKSASQVVKTRSYVSLDPVPRGKEFQAAVVVNIESGYHMNSHKPLDAYLIPTSITPELPAGIHIADTIYPPGQIKKFSFSTDKGLDVYTGSVTLRLRLTADEGSRLGEITIPMTLRYQACNDSACLPPVKVPVSVQLHIAASGTSSHALHPGIFSAASSQQK